MREASIGGDHRAGGQGAVDHHRRADHNHGGVDQALDGHPPADQVLRQSRVRRPDSAVIWI
jgi:hypothetical protein